MVYIQVASIVKIRFAHFQVTAAVIAQQLKSMQSLKFQSFVMIEFWSLTGNNSFFSTTMFSQYFWTFCKIVYLPLQYNYFNLARV